MSTKEDILNTLSKFGDSPPSSDYYSFHHNNQDSDSVVIQKKSFLHNIGPETIESEWERLFNTKHFHIKLREKASAGFLRDCSFRSVAWRIFLRVLPPDISQWDDVTHSTRAKYDDLKQHYVTDPHQTHVDISLSVNNPLSQEEESPWNQFFQDNELRKEIMQDLTRTYPGEIMFEQPFVREMMLNILFIYAREEPEVLYKQGMHELLAPLVHTFYTEYMLVRNIGSSNNSTMHNIMDQEYLEHDLYECYIMLMRHALSFYKTDSIIADKTTTEEVLFKKDSKASQPSTFIVQKLEEIQNTILARYDPELQRHLEKLSIQPQLYGLRWMRLLFGREFTLPEILIIWDALFASPDVINMVEYMCVSMLLYLRDALLCSDFTECLRLLMRYPVMPDCHYMVQRSLYLRSPANYECPPNWQYQKNSSIFHARSNDLVSRTNGSVPSKIQKEVQRRVPPVVPKKKPTVCYSVPPPPVPAYKPQLITEDYKIKRYCTEKLDSLVSEVQEALTSNVPTLCVACAEQQQGYEDRLLISLAGLKQVRDVLKGNVSLDSILSGETMVLPETTPEEGPRATPPNSLIIDKSCLKDTVKTPQDYTLVQSSPCSSTTPDQALCADLETLDLFQTQPCTVKKVVPKKNNTLTRSSVLVFQDPLLGNLDEESLDDIFKS